MPRNSKSFKKPIPMDKVTFNFFGYLYLIIFAALCLFPFIFIFTGSFSSEQDVVRNGFKFIPEHWSLEAYKLIFKSPEKIINGYKVTVFITLVGTVVGVFLTAMTGYVLSRKKFKYAKGFSFYFYFTTLFSGGMIPTYILITKYLGWRNNILVLIVPYLMSVFYVLVMRSFCSGVPDEIEESGRIDGANDFVIFTKLYVPLLGPAFASIGLFTALGYWNAWYNAMMYIDHENLFPLQYQLTYMMDNINYAATMVAESGVPVLDLPQNTFRMAMVVVSIGPIILLYPFVQRFFVKGITVGSVKG